jgi:hypothetical protein
MAIPYHTNMSSASLETASSTDPIRITQYVNVLLNLSKGYQIAQRPCFDASRKATIQTFSGPQIDHVVASLLQLRLSREARYDFMVFLGAKCEDPFQMPLYECK